jgi:phosphatidylserine/phosphatidylglycerophosphate/cardiolipin synthase-like enzyme
MLSRRCRAVCLIAALLILVPAGTPALHAAGPKDAPCDVALLKNGEYYAALSRAIDGAKAEIVMAFYVFKTAGKKSSFPDVIAEKLAGAVERGVHVGVVLERGNKADSELDADNNKTAQLLRDKGIKVCFDSPQKTTHAKLVVIDRRLTFAGSHNMTQSALRHNNEVSVLIVSEAAAADAHQYIMSLCQ